jgi:hypothetical protein
MTVENLPRLSSGAQRMRRYRERRRRGLACIRVQLRRSEVDAHCMRIVGTRRAAGSRRLSGSAPSIPRCKPNCRTPTVTRNGKRVTCHLPGLDSRDRPAGSYGRR